jgi:hypothetical protein
MLGRRLSVSATSNKEITVVEQIGVVPVKPAQQLSCGSTAVAIVNDYQRFVTGVEFASPASGHFVCKVIVRGHMLSSP